MTVGVIRFVILFFLLNANAVNANDNIVLVTQVSSSGKTVYLNRGKFDTIKQDELGILVLEQKLDKAKSIFKPVAKLKSIKIFDRQSVWIAYEIFLPEYLERGQKLVLLSENALLQGRTRLEITKASLVVNKNKYKEIS